MLHLMHGGYWFVRFSRQAGWQQLLWVRWRTRFIRSRCPEEVFPKKDLSSAAVKNYSKLAKLCKKEGLLAASDALREHALPTHAEMPPLTWLDEVKVDRMSPQQAASGSVFYQHLPHSFKLMAGTIKQKKNQCKNCDH